MVEIEARLGKIVVEDSRIRELIPCGGQEAEEICKGPVGQQNRLL